MFFQFELVWICTLDPKDNLQEEHSSLTAEKMTITELKKLIK